MKNTKLEISDSWIIKRDEFYDLNPNDPSISLAQKEDDIYCQENLLNLKKNTFNIDLGWYGGNEEGQFQLYLFRGNNWHSCELLEKIGTTDYQFLIRIINNIVRNIDNNLYDGITTKRNSIDDYTNTDLVSTFQITHTLIKSKDKVESLKFYLESNKNDNEGDSWIFGHNPNIIEHLDSFNESDSRQLMNESEKWDDNVICSLADPISECHNPSIQGNYFYCKIFLQINLFDELEYLIENLVPIASNIKTKLQTEFYNDLLEKAKYVNEKSQGNYDYAIEQLQKLKADNRLHSKYGA